MSTSCELLEYIYIYKKKKLNYNFGQLKNKGAVIK